MIYTVSGLSTVSLWRPSVAAKKSKSRSRGATQAKTPLAHATDRPITHEDVMQASARIDPDLRRRSQLLWADRWRPQRGPKPALTPDDVVQAADEIADDTRLADLT